MNIKLMVFDLDGTLIDSSEDITFALNLTLKEYNLDPLTEDEVKKFIGSGVRRILEMKLTDPEAFDLFRQNYMNHLVDKTCLYPGILEVLKETSVKKVILTNKMNMFVGPMVEALKLKDYFEGIYGLESFPTHKPDPGPLFAISRLHEVGLEEIIMIGDTDNDILAGKAAGVSTYAVTWGYGDKESLRALNPTMLISSPVELSTFKQKKDP